MALMPLRKTRRRFEIAGQARFLTFSCFKRLPLLHNDAIKNAFVEQLCLTRNRLRFALNAWVVMPDHVHLLLVPDPPTVTVTAILTALKRPFAARVLQRWRELDAPILTKIVDASGLERFWQPGGGYDRNIDSDAEFFEKVQYIHNNPVMRGLVASPVDWPWSSARWYSGRREGTLALDATA
jgi:putative transposase